MAGLVNKRTKKPICPYCNFISQKIRRQNVKIPGEKDSLFRIFAGVKSDKPDFPCYSKKIHSFPVIESEKWGKPIRGSW
jgi:hypothetical protein